MDEAPEVMACLTAHHILLCFWKQLGRPQVTWQELIKGSSCAVLDRSLPFLGVSLPCEMGSDFLWAFRKWGLEVEERQPGGRAGLGCLWTFLLLSAGVEGPLA